MEQLKPISQPRNYKAIADIIEDKPIRYPHTEEDKQSLQAKLSEHSVEQSMLNQELSDFKAELKPKLDRTKKGIASAITAIRRGYEEIKTEVYGIADHDRGIMEFYTADGEMVESRRLLPEERQLILKPTY